MRETRVEIEHVWYDRGQPWRVWFRGQIIWFAKSRGEAEEKLKIALANTQ